MENHHDFNRKRSSHNRVLARQTPTSTDIVTSPTSTPVSTPASSPSSTPPSTPVTPPTTTPGKNNNNEGQAQPSRTPSSSNNPPSTPTSASSKAVETPSTTSSSAVSSSSESSSVPSTVSSTTVISTTASLPGVTVIRQTSSFNTLPKTTFVNTATLPSSALPSTTAASTSALNTGAIVGGIGGGIAGVVLLVVLVMFVLRRLRRRSYDDDQFDSVTFRRSAVLLDDAPAAPSNSRSYDTFNPRPPSMIERKLNAHTVAPSPVPQGAYINYDSYDYGAQQGDYDNGYNQNYQTNNSDNGHGGYSNHPYAQDVNQQYSGQVPTTNPYASTSAVPAARATRTGAPRDSRVISRVDDEDVYGGI